MKRLIAVACMVALASGCAGPSRPSAGPGSGHGADYVPSVEPNSATPEAYNASLTKCRGWANDLPYRNSGRDTEAFVFVNTAAYLTYLVQTPLTGIWEVIGGTGVGIGEFGFFYWMQAPQRERWHSAQETMMMNCMARDGFVNTDPTVKVTWVKPDPKTSYLRPTGRDTYNAEHLAKQNSCSALPMAALVRKGPGFEVHSVACTNGQTMTIRCEFGNCRVTDRLASN